MKAPPRNLRSDLNLRRRSLRKKNPKKGALSDDDLISEADSKPDKKSNGEMSKTALHRHKRNLMERKLKRRRSLSSCLAMTIITA